jgi:hypothetical protein
MNDPAPEKHKIRTSIPVFHSDTSGKQLLRLGAGFPSGFLN